MAAPKDYKPPTLEEAERALYCIPADCPESEWSAVGMALASEFPTVHGFDLFNRWSATATTPGKYKPADTKSRWNGWTRKTGKTIASLFYTAKAYGYRPNPNAAPPSPEELARREREKAERDRQQQETEQHRKEEAAHAEQRAADLWAKAKPVTDAHGYLMRKGIEAHGLRLFRGNLSVAGMALDGCLMVPAVDLDGTVKSLQFIHPDIPGKDGKRNLPKAEIKGRFWRLGEFTDTGPVYIAEGPATAASIFEASGACTLCAFSAGNLEAVAVQIRQRYPKAHIILCPDNDPTGLKNAIQAARAVAGLVALPVFAGKLA